VVSSDVSSSSSLLCLPFKRPIAIECNRAMTIPSSSSSSSSSGSEAQGEWWHLMGRVGGGGGVLGGDDTHDHTQ